MMKKIQRQVPSISHTPAPFNRAGRQPFFPGTNLPVQKQSLPAPDPIHATLLDQYSRETGISREQATQHDPAYEAWLLARSPFSATLPVAAQGPINIVLDMAAPATDPAPDYSIDENGLGAWERANFQLVVQQFSICDNVVHNGVESSFVTTVNIRFTRSDFEYFIARHIHENMNDMSKDVSERIIWRQIHGRILRHAREHFVRYRQMTDLVRQDFLQRFSALPSRIHPIQISQQALESYMTSLLAFLVARMRYQLWKTTCDWEKADYPVLLKGIPDVSGRFVPACGPAPVVPAEPLLPIVVTPRGSIKP